MLSLWPYGYKYDVKTCCPAMELMDYVQAHGDGLQYVELRLRQRFISHADTVMRNAAMAFQKKSIDIGDITFVGVHDRRTVSWSRYGTSDPRMD